MRDSFDDAIGALDAPRPMEPGFRATLERTLLDAAAGGTDADRWTIDAPRPMPAATRARIEAALTRRRGPSQTRIVAAAIAVLLVASTVAVVDRTGAKRIPSRAPGPALAAPSAKPSAKASPRPVKRSADSLQAFASPSDFLRYVDGQAIKLVTPYGLDAGYYFDAYSVAVPTAGRAEANAGAPAPAMAPASSGQFSQTNIQEQGVDEPDLVQTDGRRLVVLNGSGLSLLGVQGGRATLESSLHLTDGRGILLSGDRVIVVRSLAQAPKAAARAVHVQQRQWTAVTVVSIADSHAMRILSSMDIEGAFVGARLAGGVVRLVVQSGALGPPLLGYRGNGSTQSLASSKAANQRALLGSFVGDWMPHYIVERAGLEPLTGHVHGWNAVSHPPGSAGLAMLTVLTIDPADPRPNNAASVIGSGQIVYSSTKTMYVTSNNLDDVVALRSGRVPTKPVTRIHAFDISNPARARYIGSGDVPGFLLNQFSMSEYGGALRVASTLTPLEGSGPSQSFVTVLKNAAGNLVRVGSIGNVGLGERIYSVRFIGSKGYVVTFKQVDPLYVIDLTSPARPRIAGVLEMPGYSGYLHPISDTLLLGVGLDVGTNNEPKGLLFSLFDVSDPSHPRRLSRRTVDGSWASTEVTEDHHAFLYWAPKHLMVVPASIQTGSSSFTGALAVTVQATDGFGAPVRLTHVGRSGAHDYDATIRRSVVIGNELLTISDAGVLVSSLDTFASRQWVPLQG
jgi:uncharacterized secreted protein with C-terminal beta-propeller domain